jgi:arsenate reductase
MDVHPSQRIFLVMAKTPRILFVCTGNSARSQIAEGFARYYGGDMVEVDSAGTEPKGLNPNAVWVMNEAGIDISGHTSDPLDGKNLESYDHVVTLCGDARDHCPALPAAIHSEHWDLTDPASTRGHPLEVLEAFRLTRFQVERRVKDLLFRILGGDGN